MTTVAPSLVNSVLAQSVRFVENGAGTYQADFILPPNAVLVDIIVTAEVLWAAATSAALTVGDVDAATGFVVSTNLLATDLLAATPAESISIGGQVATAGGKIGAYGGVGTNTHQTRRQASSSLLTASPRTITAKVVSVGAGAAGITRVDVIYISNAPMPITQ